MSLENKRRERRTDVSRSSADYLANPNKPHEVKEKVQKEKKTELKLLQLKLQQQNNTQQQKEKKQGGKGTKSTLEEAQQQTMTVEKKTDAGQSAKQAKIQKAKEDKQMQMEKSPTSSA